MFTPGELEGLYRFTNTDSWWNFSITVHRRVEGKLFGCLWKTVRDVQNTYPYRYGVSELIEAGKGYHPKNPPKEYLEDLQFLKEHIQGMWEKKT